jgi:hypothetical protein
VLQCIPPCLVVEDIRPCLSLRPTLASLSPWPIAVKDTLGVLQYTSTCLPTAPPPPRRYALEKAGQLDPRISVLDEEFDEAAIEAEAAQVGQWVQGMVA